MKLSSGEINEYLYQCFKNNRPAIGEVKIYMKENGSTQYIPKKLAYHFALGLTDRIGIVRFNTTLYLDIKDSWHELYINKATQMLRTIEYDKMLPLEFFGLFIDEIGIPIPNRILNYWNKQGLDLDIALTKSKLRKGYDLFS